MKSQILTAILCVALTSFLLFSLTYSEKIKCTAIYWLIPIWLILLVIAFRMWDLNKGKIVLFFHLLVLLSGLFSFLSYQLFKKLSDITPLSNSNFTNVSNLMFNSENALYLMIYGGFILLVFDTFYYLRYLKK